MRLEGQPGQIIEGEAWLYLTEQEASDLMTALRFYFEEDEPRQEWHHHLGAADPTVTIAIDPAAQ